MKDATQTLELRPVEVLTPPPGPVLAAADCPGYGRELPRGWRCPSCAVAEACYAAMLAAQENGHNGSGDER